MATGAQFSLSEEFATTDESTNHERLCRLIMKGGKKALRVVFDGRIPPDKLPDKLKKEESFLRNLKTNGKKLLNKPQLDILYPNQGSVKSSDFDITLLMVLLRNICNLQEPQAGWDKKQLDTDHSTEADIARIKWYRNKLCHGSTASNHQEDFDDWWDEISAALVRLGANQNDIDDLKTAPMDSALKEQYTKAMQEWFESDKELIQEVKKMRAEGRKQTAALGEMVEAMHDELRQGFAELKVRRTEDDGKRQPDNTSLGCPVQSSEDVMNQHMTNDENKAEMERYGTQIAYGFTDDTCTSNIGHMMDNQDLMHELNMTMTPEKEKLRLFAGHLGIKGKEIEFIFHTSIKETAREIFKQVQSKKPKLKVSQIIKALYKPSIDFTWCEVIEIIQKGHPLCPTCQKLYQIMESA